MRPAELLQENLAVIEGIAARACRRAGIHNPADVEDFASSVKLALIENDGEILRKYEGRSSIKTYLAIVIERLLLDERMRARGRFHASAEAVRLGPAAVLLESVVCRDRRTIEEALPLVRAVDPSMTRESAEALLSRLPARRLRAVAIDLDHAPAMALASEESTDDAMLAGEARQTLGRAATVIRTTLASFSDEDRVIFRFRFARENTVVEISRMLRLPQRPLYRRIESLLAKMRGALRAAGIEGSAIADVLARAASEEMDFGLMETEAARQSNDLREPTVFAEST
jgi:RNA polymerase sigma factor (sigma-70 family)